MTKRAKKLRKLRGLGAERLESRSLLAGDLGCSAWTNPDLPDDANADGAVSPLDALVTINAMNAIGSGPLAGRFAPPPLHGRLADALEQYVDTNGDSQLSPLDALRILNALNFKPTTTAAADVASDETVATDATDDASTDDSTEDSTDESTDDATTDEQPGEIGADVPEVTLNDGFGRTRSAIDTAGDVDVFQVTTVDKQLAVSLFVPSGVAMQVSLVDANGATVATLKTAGQGGHEHVTIDAEVAPGTYYLVVSGVDDATGEYSVSALNYDPSSFGGPHGGPHHHHDASEDVEDDASDLPPIPPAPPSSAALFDKIDADADGLLTLEELQAIPSPPHVTIDWTAIFSQLDADGDGAVSAEEFAAGVPSMGPPGSGRHGGSGGGGPGGPHGRPGRGAPPQAPPAPDVLFAQVDADGDGSLTLEELEAKASSPRMLAMLDQIFAQWDADGSGGLDLTEFTAGINSAKS